MSINSVTNTSGFDQVACNAPLADATTEYVSESKMDEQLLAALNSGKSLSEAVTAMQNQVPSLPSPAKTGNSWTSGLAGLPSFGANYLALITEMAAEQRRQNAQMRAQEAEELAAKIQEQADAMRSSAVTQLALGVVSGTLSIAQGVTAATMTVKGISAGEAQASAARDDVIFQGTGGGERVTSAAEVETMVAQAEAAYASAKQRADTLLNARVTSFNTAMGGTTGIMNSISQSVGAFMDADVKKMEAETERIRSQQESLKSLDEALQALIQKALSTQDSIQQSMNQTLTKILG